MKKKTLSYLLSAYQKCQLLDIIRYPNATIYCQAQSESIKCYHFIAHDFR